MSFYQRLIQNRKGEVGVYIFISQQVPVIFSIVRWLNCSPKMLCERLEALDSRWDNLEYFFPLPDFPKGLWCVRFQLKINKYDALEDNKDEIKERTLAKRSVRTEGLWCAEGCLCGSNNRVHWWPRPLVAAVLGAQVLNADLCAAYELHVICGEVRPDLIC